MNEKLICKDFHDASVSGEIEPSLSTLLWEHPSVQTQFHPKRWMPRSTTHLLDELRAAYPAWSALCRRDTSVTVSTCAVGKRLAVNGQNGLFDPGFLLPGQPKAVSGVEGCCDLILIRRLNSPDSSQSAAGCLFHAYPVVEQRSCLAPQTGRGSVFGFRRSRWVTHRGPAQVGLFHLSDD
jgi:hypothetical protein